MADTQVTSQPLTPLPPTATPGVSARAVIRDGGDTCTFVSPDKLRTVDFVHWYLRDLSGNLVVDVQFDQRENLPPGKG